MDHDTFRLAILDRHPERFTTRFEVWDESIDQPTTRRDKESSTTAQ